MSEGWVLQGRLMACGRAATTAGPQGLLGIHQGTMSLPSAVDGDAVQCHQAVEDL